MRHRGRREMWVAAQIAVLAAGLLTLIGAAPSAAVIVRLGGGAALSYQPIPGAAVTMPQRFDAAFHNLDYSGGPVMPSNTNYAFYWSPAGAPEYPADYRLGLARYFEDLAHDSGGSENVDSVATQYNDASGAHAAYDSHYAGAILDTNPYPSSGCAEVVPRCLADYQIQAELKGYLTAHGLPMDLRHEYFVLLPPGVESCFGTGNSSCSAGTVSHPRESFCAYHSDVHVAATKAVIVYANDPYVAGGICDDGNHPNGSTADATISGGLSHEHNESVTDPEPNSSWTDWATGASTGFENGDKCRTFNPATEYGTPLGTAPNGAKYDQVLNGHLYWYQQEWSNQGHRCLQRFTFSGEAPKASYTFQAGAEEATFNAAGSTAPGGVAYYDWQVGESGAKQFESTVPAFVLSAAPGVRRVSLTVFAADGTGNATSHLVNIGGQGLPSIVRLWPSRGPVEGGTTVTITGINLGGTVSGVSFGSVAAASFTEASPTKLIAVAPASAAGTVDVTVTTSSGTSSLSTADRYSFGPPKVTGVSPNSGPKGGGTSVSISGRGFAAGGTATSIKFGGLRASGVACQSSTACTATAPRARTAGLVEVSATVNGVRSSKLAAAHFTYR